MKISVKFHIFIVKSYNVLCKLSSHTKLRTPLIDLHFKVHTTFCIIMLKRWYKAIL